MQVHRRQPSRSHTRSDRERGQDVSVLLHKVDDTEQPIAQFNEHGQQLLAHRLLHVPEVGFQLAQLPLSRRSLAFREPANLGAQTAHHLLKVTRHRSRVCEVDANVFQCAALPQHGLAEVLGGARQILAGLHRVVVQ